MPPELGESLSQILDQIEELGVDEFPPEMENDLRRAMMLPLTPTFPVSEDDDEDPIPDLPADPTTSSLNFPLEMAEVEAEVASASGGVSEVLRVGLFPLPPIDCDSAAAASFPPELRALFAYESCAAFLTRMLNDNQRLIHDCMIELSPIPTENDIMIPVIGN